MEIEKEERIKKAVFNKNFSDIVKTTIVPAMATLSQDLEKVGVKIERTPINNTYIEMQTYILRLADSTDIYTISFFGDYKKDKIDVDVSISSKTKNKQEFSPNDLTGEKIETFLFQFFKTILKY